MNMKTLKTIKMIIVIIAVVCIPIMYSFFYLKSYWDPYGRLKNMTIAMVNLDEGQDGENLGQEFIDALIEKDVVNIKQVDQEEAEKGLVNEDYFAIITVPKSFTEYLNSANSTDKHVATITYSPNQKYNYLASQIINKVVTSAETTLESQVSEKVVETLSNNLKEIPDSLEEINDGVGQLLDGSDSLSNGLNEINSGVGTLQNKYTEFDNGVKSAYSGSQTLNDGIGQVNSGVSSLSSGANQLDSAMTQINAGANTLATSAGAGITTLTDGMSQVAGGSAQIAEGTAALVTATAADSQLASGASQVANGMSALVAGTSSSSQLGAGASSVSSGLSTYVATMDNLIDACAAYGIIDASQQGQLKASGAALSSGASGVSSGIATLNAQAGALSAGASAVSSGITTLNGKAQELNAGAQKVSAGAAQLASAETAASLNQLVSGMGTIQSAISQVKTGTSTLKTGVDKLGTGTSQLQAGSQTLTDGLGTLSSASTQVSNALNTLKNGTQAAYNGSLELKGGIQELKDGVADGIDEANEQIVKLDGLSDFVKDSVEIEEVDYGEIEAYGTAFTPLFISVGLWVGALMSYVVFYYDQERRFKILGKFAENKYLQSICYLGIAILQGVVTGFLLDLGLDLNITSYGLYYGSCVLISITFMSIVQFLILNFGEVGKMMGLLILVLQLASSGGTFPVALIDEGFQKLTPYLPMTYTIKLTKEAVIKQEPGNASHFIAIMMGYTITCVAITFIVQKCKKIIKCKKENSVGDTTVTE